MEFQQKYVSAVASRSLATINTVRALVCFLRPRFNPKITQPLAYNRQHCTVHIYKHTGQLFYADDRQRGQRQLKRGRQITVSPYCTALGSIELRSIFTVQRKIFIANRKKTDTDYLDHYFILAHTLTVYTIDAEPHIVHPTSHSLMTRIQRTSPFAMDVNAKGESQFYVCCVHACACSFVCILWQNRVYKKELFSVCNIFLLMNFPVANDILISLWTMWRRRRR